MSPWHEIPSFGAYDFEGFYEQLVADAPPGARIVEVGCYQGRSLVHLGLLAKQANKGLRIVGVDWGGGMIGTPTVGDLFGHLQRAALLDTVTLVIGDSVRAAELFSWQSCWCVFLDAAHTPHEAVAADIKAWMPRVEPDGWLAGHDYRWHTVCEPVNALLGGVQHDPRWDNVWKAPAQYLYLEEDIHRPTTIPQGYKVWLPIFRGERQPNG